MAAETQKEVDMDWLVALPKVELHAHLNGSIRDSTLLELAKDLDEKGIIVFSDVEHVIKKNDRSLHEVFKLFDLIHILTTDHKTVTRITKEVVEDFAAENVVYLELRTTPKRNDSKGMSKRSYIEAVLEGLSSISTIEVEFSRKFNTEIPANSRAINNLQNGVQKKKIFVGLLLSIDRRESTQAAMETVELALEMRHRGVVGIDLSGNPVIGIWETFLPALKFAKEQGLSITLHCGEVPNPKEIHAMLDFQPGRIGHACCFGDDEWQKLKSSNIPVRNQRRILSFHDMQGYIYGDPVECAMRKELGRQFPLNDKFQFFPDTSFPVEICLTSNIRTETISSVDVHHFADLYSSHHPLVLCTDDAGVFSTSLSGEYNLASSAFGLKKRDMFELAREAIDFTFADDGVKRKLQEMFTSAKKELEL